MLDESQRNLPEAFLSKILSMKAKGGVTRKRRRRLEKCIYIPLPDLNSRKERIKINLRTMEVYMIQKKLAAKDYDIKEAGSQAIACAERKGWTLKKDMNQERMKKAITLILLLLI